MNRAMILAVLALSGCSMPHLVKTRYVKTYCVTRAQFEELKRTQPGKIHGGLTGDAEQDILTITANAIRLRAHDDGLLEVLGGCVEPESPTEAQVTAEAMLDDRVTGN